MHWSSKFGQYIWLLDLLDGWMESQGTNCWTSLTIILSDTFQMLAAVLDHKEPTFFLPVVHKEVYSPTDELVFSRKVEVTVQLQVSCPPLHPVLLDVCVKGKHLLAHKKYLQFRFMFWIEWPKDFIPTKMKYWFLDIFFIQILFQHYCSPSKRQRWMLAFLLLAGCIISGWISPHKGEKDNVFTECLHCGKELLHWQ